MSFDISKHEWSDGDISKVKVNTFSVSGNSLIEILTESSGYHYTSIWLNKQDSIAIAKHFGLTAEDLK